MPTSEIWCGYNGTNVDQIEQSREGDNEIMYVCRKIRLCSYLLSKGFKYESEREDKYDPNRKVWIFKTYPELYNAIEEYYSQIKS